MISFCGFLFPYTKLLQIPLYLSVSFPITIYVSPSETYVSPIENIRFCSLKHRFHKENIKEYEPFIKRYHKRRKSVIHTIK